VVANKSAIGGGGVYSVAGGKLARMVGKKLWPVAEIEVMRSRGGVRGKDGIFRAGWVDPFMPKKLTEPFHPSGNSVCYMIQLAHLMGANPIHLLGFTLQNGLGYQHGRTNPVTGRTTFYADPERALTYLRWLNERFPDRIFCDPDWGNTPVGEVFQVRRAEGSTEEQ